MLYRKVYDEIKKWINDDKRSLLVDGARQVGKTTIIRECLEDNNVDYIEINLIDNSLARQAFDTSKNVNELLLKLSALITKPISDNTLFFIDEIQEPNDALTPIKFLVEKTNYRFVFSGSLLGIKLKDIESIGTGYIKFIKMYPLDFEEFAIANGVSKKIFDYIYHCFVKLESIDELVHDQLIKLFNTYLIVGGMPDVVQTFVLTHNIQKVIDIQASIDLAYIVDITKYDKKEKLNIEEIYNIIPSDLNAENKRMILKNTNEKSRFYQYEESFAWLKNSGVGLFTYNVDNPVYPLSASKERTLFKLFMCDVGLLSYKLLNGNQIKILNGDVNLNFGALYEAVVAQELSAHGFDLFYNNNKKRGEVDFLIEDEVSIIPIEVKSGKDYKRHSALNNMIDDFQLKKAIVLTNDNLLVKGVKIYYPVYMIMFFHKKIKIEKEIYIPNIDALL